MVRAMVKVCGGNDKGVCTHVDLWVILRIKG